MGVLARGAAKISSVSGALTVTFTAASGATPTVYSDEALTTTISLPATVTDGATQVFYFASPGQYTVSVKDSTGTQIAGDLNQTRVITVYAGDVAALSYDCRRVARDASGDTGRRAAKTESDATYLPGISVDGQGALGDGSTDDSTAIQAAYNLAAAGPGVVHHTPGKTYIVGATVYIPDGLIVWAYGATIKAKAGWKGQPFASANQKTAVFAPPNIGASGSSSGGTLAAGTYRYTVTAVTATGETMPGQPASAATTGSTGSVTITWSAPTVPSGGPAITGYNVYGRAARAFVKLGTTAAGTLTFTDTGAAGSGNLPTTNANIATRQTSKTAVLGGTWDCNRQNRSCDFVWGTSGLYSGHMFDMQKCDDLTFRDMRILNADEWCIAVADFGELVTENIDFNTNRDGIHVLGPGKSWSARRITGTTGDDMLGVSLAEWPTMAVSAGNIGRVELHDIDGTAVPSVLRVLGAAGYTLGQLIVEGVSGTYTGSTSFLGALYIADDQPNTGYYSNGTDVLMSRFADISIAPTTSTSPVLRLAGRNMTTVDIERITLPTGAAAIPSYLVYVFNATDGTTNPAIERLNVKHASWGQNAPAIMLDGGSTIKSSLIEKSQNNAGSGNPPTVRTGSTTIGVLTLRKCRQYTASNSGYLVEFTGSQTITRVIYDDCYLERGNGFGYVGSGGTISAVALRNCTAAACNIIINIQQTSALDIDFDGLYSAAGPGSFLIDNASGVRLTVRGRAIRTSSNVPVINSGQAPTSLRLIGAELRGDKTWSYLTQTDGDEFYNTNAVPTVGAGRLISNGTTWKNLYSGAT